MPPLDISKPVGYFLKCFSATALHLLRTLFNSVPHLKIVLFASSMCSFLSFSCILDLSFLLDVLAKSLFPVYSLKLCPDDGVLHSSEAFQCHEVPFINYCFLCPCCLYSESLLLCDEIEATPHFLFYQSRCT